MTKTKQKTGTGRVLDAEDRAILQLLQADASQSLLHIANKTGLSKTAVWNRIQRMTSDGVIVRQAALLDAQKIGLSETFFVSVKTSQHNAKWFQDFVKIVEHTPEITEAHRLAGEIDYLLKVQVSSTRDFDDFYKKLVSRIDLFNVTSSLSMESFKEYAELPVHDTSD